jgi:hypothetical protein
VIIISESGYPYCTICGEGFDSIEPNVPSVVAQALVAIADEHGQCEFDDVAKVGRTISGGDGDLVHSGLTCPVTPGPKDPTPSGLSRSDLTVGGPVTSLV